MSCTVLEQVFQSMRYNRRYHPGFIAKRQKLERASVVHVLNKLVKNGMVERIKSPVDGRIKLYISKQQHLNLI